MSLRLYLILMSLGTFMCWFACFMVLKNVNPYETGYTGFIFFYLTLLLALTGTFSVIGFILRQKFSKSNTVIFKHVRHAFRQGLLISCMLIVSLVMLQFKLLNLITGSLLVLMFLITESILLANRKFKNREYLLQEQNVMENE